jgi:glycosyltransferase involved in cell wall biosynthesis
LRAAGDTVDIISRPWRNYAAHLTDNFSGAFAKQLAGKYDLLLQDELNHPSLFLVNQRLPSTPKIAIVHHLRASEQRPTWQNALYRIIEKRYLDSVDGFIFNSTATRTTVEGLTPSNRPSLTALPAGDRPGLPLTPEQVAQRIPSRGRLRLLFVGNLIPRKGLDTLLDALARTNANWALTIAGSPAPDPAYARHIARRAQAFSQPIKITGALSDTEITQLYLEHDVLVVPSAYEGFGIVYLEGMGAGLPAIGTIAGGATEIITHGQDGYLIAPGDDTALAYTLNTLIQDRDLLRQMSLAALNRFHAHPTWQQSMAASRQFLLTLV